MSYPRARLGGGTTTLTLGRAVIPVRDHEPA